MVGPMGASAVLLFVVPHGQLSQPWAATGGQLISAAVGVVCAQRIQPPVLAAAAAVSLAVLAMHYARCIHPPGGATALAAVIGGPSIHALGYAFIVRPVMINALTILAIAFAFNNLFRWRRYPAFLLQRHTAQPSGHQGLQIELEDVVNALQEIDSPIDALRASGPSRFPTGGPLEQVFASSEAWLPSCVPAARRRMPGNLQQPAGGPYEAPDSPNRYGTIPG